MSATSSQSDSRRSAKSALFWGLAVVNCLLVALVVLKYSPSQQAHAQAARPSDYLMVPGSLTGVVTGVVFMVDTSHGELSAMTYDDTNNTLSPMQKVSLEQVFKAGGGVGAAKIRPR